MEPSSVSIEVTRARLTRYANRMDRDETMRALRAFEAAGLEYVLIGAAAMAFHGVIRATEDLDLFVRAGEVASFETIDAEIKEVDGTQVRVATASALYQLKKGTVRLQDRADAAALRKICGLKDEN